MHISICFDFLFSSCNHNIYILIVTRHFKDWFETSNYGKDDNRPLPIGMHKVIRLLKNELGGKFMIKFIG